MGKSLLLIDTPESCVKCPLKSQMYDNQYICSGNHRRMAIPGIKNKPDWCPLRDLPEKKELSYEDFAYDIRAATWNSCIDAITGMQDKKRRQQGMELEALNAIAFMTSKEFAKTAADVLGRKNRVYDFEWYLVLLGRLQELISAGIPNDIALDIAQIDIPIDIFISSYKPANAMDGK